MSQTKDSSATRLLNDEELIRVVDWPRGLSAPEIRRRIAEAERYIDFDDTLVDWTQSIIEGREPRFVDPFCGRPLHAFLAERPYLIQTHAINGYPYFTFFPESIPLLIGDAELDHPQLLGKGFPPPLLLLAPPRVFLDQGPGVKRKLSKDFTALGITRGEIYDDLDNGQRGICMPPGCTLITTFR